MASIISVRIEDRYLELASPDNQLFGKLFDIDSVNLLLGKNGSGKTRFLLGVAKAMTAPKEDDLTHVYFNINESLQKHNFCSIYYSALPYRKRLSPRAGLIDASPRAQIQDENVKVSHLCEVAASLEIDTKITGTFGYTRKVYRAALVPALRKASQIRDEELKDLFIAYSEQASGIAESNEELKQIDSTREELFKKAESRLNYLLFHHIGGYEQCLFLAAIEYLYEKQGNANEIANAFLNHFGITKGVYNEEDFEKLEEVVENTREVLGSYHLSDSSNVIEKTYEFTIPSIGGITEIKRYETPIKIEWAELSSGLHALVEQFHLIALAVATAASRNRLSVLLLIDEGDAYLHLEWQRKYFSLLNKYLGNLKRKYGLNSLQLILASHSPILAADLPNNFVTNLDAQIEMKTFAAPIEDIIAGSFESSSLGEFAAQKINDIYRRAKNSTLTKHDHMVIDSIGDHAIYTALQREIKNDN